MRDRIFSTLFVVSIGMIYLSIGVTVISAAKSLDLRIATVCWALALTIFAVTLWTVRELERRAGNDVPHWRFWR
jgi:lipopolysaccharide export LptBFGC system permease protein LptF